MFITVVLDSMILCIIIELTGLWHFWETGLMTFKELLISPNGLLTAMGRMERNEGTADRFSFLLPSWRGFSN
jgi:hypothetical protein